MSSTSCSNILERGHPMTFGLESRNTLCFSNTGIRSDQQRQLPYHDRARTSSTSTTAPAPGPSHLDHLQAVPGPIPQRGPLLLLLRTRKPQLGRRGRETQLPAPYPQCQRPDPLRILPPRRRPPHPLPRAGPRPPVPPPLRRRLLEILGNWSLPPASMNNGTMGAYIDVEIFLRSDEHSLAHIHSSRCSRIPLPFSYDHLSLASAAPPSAACARRAPRRLPSSSW